MTLSSAIGSSPMSLRRPACRPTSGASRRLCRQQRIWSTTTKKGRKHSAKAPGPAVLDDLVQREFTGRAANVVRLTDITEHPTVEGKVYVCSIKDVFSNRIVGYVLIARMTAELAVSALRSAIVAVNRQEP